jgi:hypothetical protein
LSPETVNPGALCMASKGFSKGVPKPTTSFYSVRIWHFDSVLFCLIETESVYIYLQLYEYYELFVPVWSNVVKLMPDSSLHSSYRTTFHISIIHEYSLFQFIIHMWHFDVDNNTTEL